MTKLFGLREKKTGNLACVVCSGNGDAEFCGSYEASLESWDAETPFLVHLRRDADRVLEEPVDWYNSNMSYPQLGEFVAEDLEVVEVELQILTAQTLG